MKINSSYVIAAAVALVAGGWILSGQIGGKTEATETAKEADTQTTAKITTVRVKTLDSEAWQREIIIRGQTAASRSVTSRAETAGRIQEISVTEGSALNQGDKIAQIDPAERIAELKESQALERQRTVEFKAAKQLAQKGFRAETKLAEAAALLDAARAKVIQVKTDIERTTIRAPFEGILEKRHVEQGDYVRIGDEVARIVDLDPIYIVGAVSEREVSRIKIGLPARITLVDGREITGMVRFIGAVADPVTRTFRMEVSAPNPDGVIRDGLTSRITLKLEPVRAHFLSSSFLTLDDEGRLGVKGVDEEKIVRFYPIKIISDRSNGVWAEGLPDRVTLITVGQGFVKPGQTVETSPDKSGLKS